jgi:hypothetical protein
MTGHRKGRQKWASAEQKRQHEELEREWHSNMKQWQSMNTTKIYKSAKNTYQPLSARVPPGRETKHIPSLDTGHKGAVSSKPAQQYTGTKIIGIGTLHKSNAVPVFSDEEAKDMARMRRG